MTSIEVSRGSVLGGKWLVGELVGEGACGKVFKATLANNNVYDYELVVKIIPIGIGKTKKAKDQDRMSNTLNYEYMLYTGPLNGFPYAPKLPDKFYGTDLGVRYLVMEKLDMDLVSYSKQNNPDHSMIATIGLQLLLGLEWLHKKGFLFIDIKPQNFMIKNNKVYFIDYGLVERWVSFNSVGSRIAEAREMVGTPAFASISVHRGETPSRKDDIESMALVLLSLASEGRLPWSNSSSDAQCKQMKESCDIFALANERDCNEIAEIIQMTRLLNYNDVPDYRKFEQLLTSMRDRKTITTITSSIKRNRNSINKSSSSEIISTSTSANISNSNKTNESIVKSVSKVPSPIITKKSKSTRIALKSITNTNINNNNLPFSNHNNNNNDVISLLDDSDSNPFSSQSSTLLPIKVSLKVENISSNKIDSVNDSKLASNSISIEVVEGIHKGDKFILNELDNNKTFKYIGRSVDNDIYSLNNDEFISERHIKLKVEDSRLFIMDNDSSHGTKLDGKQLRKRRWHSVDAKSYISIGETLLYVQ